MKRLVPLLLVVTACAAPATRAIAAAPEAPANLRSEYLVDPLGIDETAPRFYWEMVDPRRGAIQTAYRVVVARSRANLEGEIGDLWDSGKVESNQTIHVVYAGVPLVSRTHAFWKVRVWGKDGSPSPWSNPASFSIGLLEQSDWQAHWIGDPAPPPPLKTANNGYHSEMADSAEAEKWIAIDLGEEKEIDSVWLYPARPYNWTTDAPGFLFPRRFRIELAHSADFARARTVADRTAADVPNPGTACLSVPISGERGRFIRLVATSLAERDAGEYGLALAEMQVLSEHRNVAAGAEVTAKDSIEKNDWSTSFLVDDDLESHGPQGWDPLPPPLLRKTFTLTERSRVVRATAYVTALGLYELRINGQRVGDYVLAPEWTDYHQRVQYQAYDITGLLKDGENAVGALLGDGWYAGKIGLTFIVPNGPPRGIYGRQPLLLAQIEIENADGSQERIVTDDTWKSTTAGPLRVTDLLDGETIDARRELPGWDAPGFDDSDWRPARVFEATAAKLVAQMNEPIRVVREIRPVGVNERQQGVYIFDLGQNMVGWCRLSVEGDAGDTVRLRHAEVLNEDGGIYTENLRGAAQTDTFILRGGGPELFEPRFTYHGFRYVEVSGLRGTPTLDSLTGCVVHSDAPEVGEFECSDEMLNQLWRNIIWTQRANMHSTPTDCPQRDERLGWTGDILAFCQTGCFNMDMAAFLTKWLGDMRDAQTEDGRYPDFAPHPFDPAARFSGVPAWGDAGVHVAWCHYLNYGDRRLLKRHFESARRWVDWIHRNNPDLLWKNQRNNDYGDWLNADTLKLEGWPTSGAGMPKEVFATAFFARSAEIVALMAEQLSFDEQWQRYGKLATDIRAAFIEAYVEKDGRIEGDTQGGYAIALSFELLPEELREAAAGHMVACFDRYDGLISTGFHSTACLMSELTRAGRVEEAYRLINNRKMPSWGYAIDHGATTIWERWDGFVEGRGFRSPGMNSFSHYALGSVGEWMYRSIPGVSRAIGSDPGAPGYARFVLRPLPGGGLSWARGAVHTILGRIACEWRLEGNTFFLDVTVPPGAEADLILPTESAAISESGGPLGTREGVLGVLHVGDGVYVRLAAGNYRFEVERG